MEDDEIQGREVLRVVREELALLASSSPEAVFEVEAALDEALREVDDEGEYAGAVALATLVELATDFDLGDFRQLLSDLKEILPVSVDDVRYVDTSITGVEMLQLSEFLPAEKSSRMQPGDRDAAVTFVYEVVRPGPSDPDSNPEPGSGPGRNPKRTGGPR